MIYALQGARAERYIHIRPYYPSLHRYQSLLRRCTCILYPICMHAHLASASMFPIDPVQSHLAPASSIRPGFQDRSWSLFP